MRPSRPSAWSAAIVALAIASLADARPATLKDRARLRSGPSSTSDLLGELAPGTTVEVVGDTAGWRQVQTPDGQTGYLWNDHLLESDAGDATRRDAAAPATTGARSLQDDVRSLRDDVAALRDRPAPASGVDMDKLRAEVERLASVQQLLARRLDERLLPAADPPPSDAPLAGLGPLIFVLGGVVGWAVGRTMQRRRDSRQRNRIRI